MTSMLGVREELRPRAPTVEIRDLQFSSVSVAAVTAAVQRALDWASVPVDRLGVVLVDTDRIMRLNREFLGRCDPTDVIAFPVEKTEQGYCGEIIICVPVAVMQALEHQHGLDREMAILSAHGTLHAIGYRDDTLEGKAAMDELQNRIADEIAARA
jgi:probable rRNA maturation factor